MQAFEEEHSESTPEPITLSTKLALLAGALLVLALVTFIGVHGGYVDVEQATDASPTTATSAVAIQVNR
jgi:hypothetical protein